MAAALITMLNPSSNNLSKANTQLSKLLNSSNNNCCFIKNEDEFENNAVEEADIESTSNTPTAVNKLNENQIDDEAMDTESDEANASINGNSGSIDWKPMRSRSFLTDAQVDILNEQFKRNRFPSKYELSALAECISVNKRVVQVIFFFNFFILLLKFAV